MIRFTLQFTFIHSSPQGEDTLDKAPKSAVYIFLDKLCHSGFYPKIVRNFSLFNLSLCLLFSRISVQKKFIKNEKDYVNRTL